MARFVLGEGWVMEKLNVKINAPDDLVLDQYRAQGLQIGETELPQGIYVSSRSGRVSD
jgi:hypothetical protein